MQLEKSQVMIRAKLLMHLSNQIALICKIDFIVIVHLNVFWFFIPILASCSIAKGWAFCLCALCIAFNSQKYKSI